MARGELRRAVEVPDDETTPRRRVGRWLLGLAGLAVGGIFVAVLWYAYLEGLAGVGGEPPLVRAEAGPYKREPADRGGLRVNNLDATVVDVFRPAPAEPVVEALPPPAASGPEPGDGGERLGAGPDEADPATLPPLLAPEPAEAAGESVAAAPEPDAPPSPVVDPAPSEPAAGEPGPAPVPATPPRRAEVAPAPPTVPASPAGPTGGRAPAARPAPAAKPDRLTPPAVPVAPARAAAVPPAPLEAREEPVASPPPRNPPPAQSTRRTPTPPPPAAARAAATPPPAQVPPRRAAALDEIRRQPVPPPPAAATPSARPPRQLFPQDAPPGPQAARRVPAGAPPGQLARVDPPAPVTPRQPPPPQAGPGGYRLQLLALRTDAALGQAWSQLRQRHPGVLSGLSPSVERIETSSGSMYRLQAGTFRSREAAAGACGAIQAQGGQCFVVGAPR